MLVIYSSLDNSISEVHNKSPDPCWLALTVAGAGGRQNCSPLSAAQRLTHFGSQVPAAGDFEPNIVFGP